MKNVLILIAGCVLALSTSRASEDACCAAKAQARAASANPDACCATGDAAVAPAASAFAARSLYQLDATWTSDAGKSVQLASLRGKPVVIAMFFSHCSYACPLIVQDMRRLRDSLPPERRADTQFVLVSFDPDRDTPEALLSYRQHNQLDAGWTLLRGSAEDVQELAMLLGVKFRRDSRGDFAHSNLITVLNPEGEIVQQLSGLMTDVRPAVKALASLP